MVDYVPKKKVIVLPEVVKFSHILVHVFVLMCD